MSKIKYIDINCDLGEGESLQDCQVDEMLMPFISSCNIACGGHAGNQLTMTHSLNNAKKHKLRIGAHPGYPDRANFGRTSVEIKPTALKQSIASQVDSLISIAKTIDAQVSYIKFHGALYNDIESNDSLAQLLVEFCKQKFSALSLMGLAKGNLEKYCRQLKVGFIAEGFMDRRYLSNAKLSPRSHPDAVITKQQVAIEQAVALAKGQPILTLERSVISISVDSICLHGDNPNAQVIAKSLLQALQINQLKLGSASTNTLLN